MKDILTISRKWHNPQIRTTVGLDGIAIEIELADFIEALHKEIGTVSWVFQDKTFKLRFDAAVERVLKGIKEETIKVI